MTAHDLLLAPNAYRLKVADYLLLDRSGAFKAFAKTELIEGVLIAVNAQYVAHSRVQGSLYLAIDAACRALDSRMEAFLETSLDFNGETMPQPDVVVARDVPADGPIPRENVVLIVEVSDTTVKFDLGAKARVYATAGIPEYWVADLSAQVIHQMWTPEGETYTEQREVAFGSQISSATIDGLAIIA